MSEVSDPETHVVEPLPQTQEEAAPAVESDGIRLSPADLKGRLDRSYSARLNQRFGMDEGEVQRRLEALAEMEKAEDERRRAEQSEVDRLKEEVARYEATAAQAQEAADAAELRQHIYAHCAMHGVRDLDYAVYRVIEKAESLDEHEDDLDVGEFLQAEIAARPSAYGIEAPAPGSPMIASTSAYGAQDPRPPSPNGPTPEQPVDVMQMSPEEFNKYVAERHNL